MNACVLESSGRPGDRNTSWTMGGACEPVDGRWLRLDGAGRLPTRPCGFFFRHASHSPVGPSSPPQAHLHCSRPPHTGRKDGTGAAFVRTCKLVFIVSTLHEHAAHIGLRHHSSQSGNRSPISLIRSPPPSGFLISSARVSSPDPYAQGSSISVQQTGSPAHP